MPSDEPVLANNIAAFDGQNWNALGLGVSDYVNAMAVSSVRLLARF